jgi:hypothetical protein
LALYGKIQCAFTESGLLHFKGHFRWRSMVQGPMKWRKSLLAESHKLGPTAFRWVSKTKKWQIKAKPTMAPFWRENQLVQTQKKQELKGESSWFGEPRCKLGFKGRSNSRIQFASNESKLVSRNLDIVPTHGKVVISIPIHVYWFHFWFYQFHLWCESTVGKQYSDLNQR